ncbi:NUDIX hydrolase [Candidatus Woesearchaeota archaeon]|nr:NUDIX hydrolase [Candidatus Woesearchaeota archaeon]|tara:strand:+ start:10753 stop:11253 length:501 start_codon:yes stop_codon:yes gene_type:complete
MTEEYVYHVDEEDNVIEKVARSRMRAENLMHRGTSIFVFNSKGEILVHKRTKTKDSFPGYYDLVNGGTVAFGESYEDNAVREIEEEIGAKDVELEALFKFKYDGEMARVFIQAYRLVYDGPVIFQKEEIESGRFMPLDELKELMKMEKFCPDSVEIFKKYLEEYSK